MATILTNHAALRLLRRTGCAALGLDVSATKIGVAVSDPGRTRGLPLGAIRREKLDARGAATRRVSVRIAEAVAAHGAGVVAVGWPLELSGDEGPRCAEVRGFLRDLSREGVGADFTLVDERFSTQSARARPALSSARAAAPSNPPPASRRRHARGGGRVRSMDAARRGPDGRGRHPRGGPRGLRERAAEATKPPRPGRPTDRRVRGL